MYSKALFLPVLLLALASVVYCADFYTAVSPYVEPNLSVQIVELHTAVPSAVVVIEGNETLFVKAGRVLENPDEIAPLLREDILTTSSASTVLDSVRSNISAFRERFYQADKACTQYTGMDSHPCTDRETCVRSAFAVPLAAGYVNADGFWQAMLDWRIKRDELNASVNEVSPLLSSPITSSPDASTLRLRLSSVRDKYLTFSLNHLFLNRTDSGCQVGGSVICYEYCPKINWSLSSFGWLALEDRLSSIESSLNAINNQSARAKLIAERSAAWKGYSSQKGSLWSSMSGELALRSSSISSKLSASQKTWNDTSITSDFASWQAQANDTVRLANDGKFYRALSSRAALLNQSDSILSRIDSNNRKAAAISSRFKSVSLAIAALSSGANQSMSASLSSALAALNSSAAYPLTSRQLSDLDERSAKLEQLALSEVARKALGAPPSPPDSASQAGAISGQNASNLSNASAGGKSAPSGPLSACPLPLGLVLLAFAGACMLSKQ